MNASVSPLILYIETGSDICSVILSSGNSLLAIKESDNSRAHAQLLSVFIDEIIKENKLNYSDLNAIAVSKGPGSYTGLRIGVATAKGICFGLAIPLIAIDSLLSLTRIYLQKYAGETDVIYCPMIDARRMEVYTALFDKNTRRIGDTRALIVDENSFAGVLENNKMVFFGDGAEKCKDVIKHPNAVFADAIRLSAMGMVDEATQLYQNKQFEDVAYFEPFYLKDFVVTQSEKKVL
ncbi:MAG: tRNA (adenosine(37)-N6)-threonylcarbamoyltransferase complex dimerization subunit type 1 TsaB [Prevotellaceae bacterium]|jgi:tRNA threonylcarbamoyladenosine biosynthesis protein TsaB|nr:tRNA (adenosine(37)-N6)-threonylcarbamoyltransferase complex dimerization subunit type 1 TsaB [Prevotellaceae bacterium]